METTTTRKIRELLPTRDLRYYGIAQTAWNRQERSRFEAEAATQPLSVIDAAGRAILLALPYMNESEQGEVLAKLQTCGPRPKS